MGDSSKSIQDGEVATRQLRARLAQLHVFCTPERCVLAAHWESESARLFGFIERPVECWVAARMAADA